jgi:Uma2 family endonuclease
MLGAELIVWLKSHPIGALSSSPVELRVSDKRVVAPDMVMLAPDHPQYGKEHTQLLHPPLLAVEIVSRSSRMRDWRTKFGYYEEFGVPHYWIADPMERRIFAYSLEGGVYREHTQTSDTSFEAPPFPGLTLDLDYIFGGP